ncbi:MAG TPA: hypothetical protein VJ991_10620 [Balneolales bacterium]|nr:hypothetical protein [Balneolales bacterium]
MLKIRAGDRTRTYVPKAFGITKPLILFKETSTMQVLFYHPYITLAGLATSLFVNPAFAMLIQYVKDPSW